MGVSFVVQVELASTTSDDQGGFSVSVPPGPVQIVATREGSMTYRTTTMLMPRMVDSERIMLAPTLPAGAAGIVLVWNKVIPDMDLHMSTPWGCNVDWTNYVCRNRGGAGKAHLDRDDMYGGGPETMTIDTPAPGAFKVFVHRYSSGDIHLSEARVYVFQSDGRTFQFDLNNGDGVIEGDDDDIWKVCDIDGLTGNVIATDKARRVMQLGAVGSAASTAKSYFMVSDFQRAPSSKASLAFWMLSSADNLGTPFSYAVDGIATEFTLSNYKSFVLCVGGECGPFSDVRASNGNWHHIAVTWDASSNDPRGNAIFYLDGNKVWSGDVAKGKSIMNGGTVVLGNSQTAPGQVGSGTSNFVGQMSDVLWVNRVMSEVDVQALMMSHVTGHEAGAVLAFAMTQPDDHLTNLMDYSTSNYVGEFMVRDIHLQLTDA